MLDNLEVACAAFLAYYSLCWPTRDAIIDRTRLPAVISAGVVENLRSFDYLFDAATGDEYAIAA